MIFRSALLAALTFVCAVLATDSADARGPLGRYRGNMARSTPNRTAIAPPTQRSTVTPTISASTLRSDEKMTEIYGPSILVRENLGNQ